MAVPYHTHNFTVPVASKEETGGVSINNKVVVPSSLGTAAVKDQTDFAASALEITAGTGLTGGGDLSSDLTIELSEDAIDSLAKADTAVQPGALGSLAAKSNVNNADWSGADLAIENGGTGASTASAARTALGLGSAAVEDASAFATATQGGKADTAVQPDDPAVTRVFIPEKYGAVGDGEEDDTDAFLETIAEADGSPIYLKGRYLISLTLTDEEVHFIGPGTIVQPLGETCIKVTRPLTSEQSVTSMDTVQIGPNTPTLPNSTTIISRIRIASAYAYAEGDVAFLSSQDAYGFSTQLGTELGTTLSVWKAEIVPIIGLGLDYTSKANGGFSEGDTVTGATSGATAKILSVGNNGSTTDSIVLQSASGAFTNGENLTVAGTVRGVASGALYLLTDKKIIDTYSTTPVIAKMSKKRFIVDGPSVEADGDCETIVGASNRKSAFILQGVVRPTVRNFTVKSAWSRCWMVEGCYAPMIDIVIQKLPNIVIASEEAYGYGVDLSGATDSGVIKVNGGNCRHAFTTNVVWNSSGYLAGGLSVLQTGVPKNNVCRDSVIFNNITAPFDTHWGAYFTKFINCVASYVAAGARRYFSVPVGFQNRGFGTEYHNCLSDGAVIGFYDLADQYEAGFQNKTLYHGCKADRWLWKGFWSAATPVGGNHWTDWQSCIARGTGATASTPYYQVGFDANAGARVFMEHCRAEKFGGTPFSVQTSTRWKIIDFVADYTECPSNASAPRVDGVPTELAVRKMTVYKTGTVPAAIIRNATASAVTVEVWDAVCANGVLPLIVNTGGGSTTVRRFDGANVIMQGTAAPSSETWAVGDRVENTSPTAGSYMGWICTTAGTPGTWKGYGAISS